MAMATSIENVCNSMRQYYASLGKEAEYVDEDGVGKFTKWCDDNGMDAESLEWGEDPQESLMVDFDEDGFPLPEDKQDLDDSAKREYIMQILLLCRSGAKFNSMSFDQSNFDAVNDQDIEEVKRIYKENCPAIFNRDMGEDGNLLFMLAFQHKYGVDYLANLCDSYSRYRIEKQADIPVQAWAKLAGNKHFNGLPFNHMKVQIPNKGQKGQSPYFEYATTCMASFNKRLCGKLMFGPTRIDDSLEKVANYISLAAQFVFNTVSSNEKGVQVVPFQLDLVIVVGEPQKDESKQHGADEDEDDDDDDGADDNKQAEPAEGPSSGPYKDWVQDIQKKLAKHSLKHCKEDASKLSDNPRRFDSLFKQFLSEAKESELEESHKKHYLANKRILALVDRRNSKQKKGANDDVFMYEPLPGPYTRDMPTGKEMMTDWFLSASRTSILPPVGDYDAEIVVGNKAADATTESRNEPGMNLGAADHASGGVITLSFWVYSVEKIKLYLYFNGGIIRVLPCDVKLLLPKLFVRDDANQKYAASKEIEALVKELESKLPDKDFEKWIQANPVPDSN